MNRVARPVLTILGEPFLPGDEVPSEPSLIGTLLYGIGLIAARLSPTQTLAQIRASSQQRQPMPPGFSLENVTAAGVRAQSIWAPGAMKSHVILYLHGGGWVIGLTDSARIYAAALSQVTGAYVLLPDYRLAPEHTFPASLDDCVATYHWLLHQG